MFCPDCRLLLMRVALPLSGADYNSILSTHWMNPEWAEMPPCPAYPEWLALARAGIETCPYILLTVLPVLPALS
jgi:hypothetical protein